MDLELLTFEEGGSEKKLREIMENLPEDTLDYWNSEHLFKVGPLFREFGDLGLIGVSVTRNHGIPFGVKVPGGSSDIGTSPNKGLSFKYEGHLYKFKL